MRHVAPAAPVHAAALRVRARGDLPPVGIITMRDRVRTPACEQLIDCLRRAAKAA